MLENAIDNLSLQKDKKCNEPRYAFRKVAKKDYCEVESDESGETLKFCQLNAIRFNSFNGLAAQSFYLKIEKLKIITAYILDDWRPMCLAFNDHVFQHKIFQVCYFSIKPHLPLLHSSDNDSVDEAQLLESVKELGERVTSTSSRDANFEDNSCSSTSRESSTPLRWNLPNSFAAKTLPDGLSLRCSNFPNAVLGIFTSREFKRDTIFGPYVGVRVYNDITKISGRVWEVSISYYRNRTFIDLF